MLPRTALLALALAGCATDADDPGGPPSDAAADDADLGDATCRADRMENVIEDREILEGDFCDVIDLCARDAAQAAAITGVIGDFVCGVEGSCPNPGEVPCQWHTPDVLDAAEYQRLCAISSFDDAPLMRCWVFL